jgi:hypothetical protein
MPKSIRDELKLAASRNCRSLNAEIVFRLESSLNAEQEKAPSGTNTQGFDVSPQL